MDGWMDGGESGRERRSRWEERGKKRGGGRRHEWREKKKQADRKIDGLHGQKYVDA